MISGNLGIARGTFSGLLFGMYSIRFHDGMLSLRQTFRIDSHNLANFVHFSASTSNGNSIFGKPCCAPHPLAN